MLIFIREVSQLDCKVCKSLLTVRAGHRIANLNNLFFFVDDKTSALDVFRFIPRTHFETTLVMVRVYGYET